MVATRRLEALSSSVARRLDLPGGHWMIALSGGADSATLAWLTARIARIRAVYVHHGLPSSDVLEVAARAIAGALAVPIDVRSVTLERFNENEARIARYRALASACGHEEWVLTAHTADDQAETVLANLLRGSGVDGLAGIPARRDNIARPMLDVTRSETREVATLADLPWMDDPANYDLGPLRNRIRLRLIPQLEAEFNPTLRRHLAVAARALSDANHPGLEVGEAVQHGWRIPSGVLWAMGRVGAVRSLRLIVRRLRDGYGLDRAEAERVWAVVGGDRMATELTGRLRVERSGPWVQISRMDDQPD